MNAIRTGKTPLTICSLLLLAVVLALSGGSRAVASPTTSPEVVTCPSGQCFTDVAPGNTFYSFVNALYMDNIIGGYACGGDGEPCDAQNRPYFRPAATVTRGQIAKIVDNGRRNIADAVGHSLTITNNVGIPLVISSTVADGIDVNNSTDHEAIKSTCTKANQDCWAVNGVATTGNRPALFSGGLGTSLNEPASGTSSYALDVQGNTYRGAYINSDTPSYFSLYVDSPSGQPTTDSYSYFNSGIMVEGDLTVTGSKNGYVVDTMQNVDGSALEPGDVVVIAGNSSPVLGSIPAITVKKATEAYDSRVVGVVDEIMYVPDARTSAAYKAQEQARHAALGRRSAEELAAHAAGRPVDPALMAVPAATISDADGNVHPVANAKNAPTGTYVNVVTLGSYKAVKVDASFGAIHAGDMLVASPHAGYAMKATDKMQAFGASIGKATGDLESGTGTIPVMITLK